MSEKETARRSSCAKGVNVRTAGAQKEELVMVVKSVSRGVAVVLRVAWAEMAFMSLGATVSPTDIVGTTENWRADSSTEEFRLNQAVKSYGQRCLYVIDVMASWP